MHSTDELLGLIHRILIGNGRRLAVAESCTGGLLCHLLTSLPGASAYMEGGIVAYSAAAKEKILEVPAATISTYGVVSIETAREMASSVRRIFQADIGLSTTGNLGPDVLEGKDKGLVYIALSTAEGINTRELRLGGDRNSNRDETVRTALSLLLDSLSELNE